MEEHEIDPIYYDEAMSTDDAILWKGAMGAELESMYSNKVWDLVEVLEWLKPIECKWSIRKYIYIYGKVETCKVRLVAKGYN